MILSQEAPDDGDRHADDVSPEEFLRYLLRGSDGKVTAEVVAAAREEYGIPRSMLFRLVARFRKAQRASSLKPGLSPGNGQHNLETKVAEVPLKTTVQGRDRRASQTAAETIAG